ncbi:MAG: hypothetical protein KDA57_04380, partial [Planctomycetales bacterium]|nr:hypothetical protein [Planctomycetales bacterium]
YRVWKTASLAAVVLSLNSVVGGHAVIARVLGQLTGWSLLPGNAGWWLAASALVGGWLLGKLILDASECRAATIAYILAVGCFAAAAATAVGWSPAWAASWPETMSRVLPLGGNVLLLVGSLLFARYVTLDVQGLIEHPSASGQPSTSLSSDSAQEKNEARLTIPSKSADDEAWTDGSDFEEDESEQSDLEEERRENRRLSKAERKRHRKQKNHNRAA